MFGALESINDLKKRFVNDWSGIERIRDTLELGEAVKKRRIKEYDISRFESLSVSNVGFSYGRSQPYAISNVSFEVKRGGRMALSGRSGCGKSTVIKLILGMYEDFDGEFLLNGIDINAIKKLPAKSLRSGYAGAISV